VFDKDLVDLLLGRGRASRDLGNIDDHRLRPRVLQRRQRGESITDDHVCLFERLQAGDGQQAEISRSTTDQDHRSDARGLFDCGWSRRYRRHTVITSGRRDQLVTFGHAAGRYDQPGAGEVIRCRRAAAHDQQSPCREVRDGRPDFGRDHCHDGT
jgi:hypothetical protein